MRSDHLNKHVCIDLINKKERKKFCFLKVKTHSINLNGNINDEHRMKNLDSDPDETNRDHHHHHHHQHHPLQHQASLHMHHQRFMVADIKAEPRMSD